MVDTLYRCSNEPRRIAIQNYRTEDGVPMLNGVDFVEVSRDRTTITVHFIHPLGDNPAEESLTINHLQLEGDTTTLEIESASAWGDRLTITIKPPRDMGRYTLRLIQPRTTLNQAVQTPSGFDAQLATVTLSFNVGELSDFDCDGEQPTLEPSDPLPVIDYLAKDYASFRQLMLDRLAVTLPQWIDRSPADVGNMLIELVAYTADHLSYFQDAVATEAYLGTARRRTSVRRHARLLNYAMHDGCNARGWLVISVNQPVSLPAPTLEQPGVCFFTQVPGLPPVLSPLEVVTALNAGAQVFEPMHAMTLHPLCNEMHLYTWGDTTYELPMGATTATLLDPSGSLAELLKAGTLLLLQEVKGPESGASAEADPSRRHVVRLCRDARPGEDALFHARVVEIEWFAEDALPFALGVAQIVGDRPVANISLVRGNVVLVDHGYTVAEADFQDLGSVPVGEPFRPRLHRGPLTQQAYGRTTTGQMASFDPAQSAKRALQWELNHIQPAIVLTEVDNATLRDQPATWLPQRDLLNSSRFAREFVVETENDGRAYLRFGDGHQGRRPQVGSQFTAHYRVGNGGSGNVGAGAIAHLFAPEPALAISLAQLRQPLYNPLPTQGGVDPEPLEQVRLYAPQAFTTLQRAVTEADYVELVQRFPGVAKALATRRWTGSWYTFFITVDRAGGRPVDDAFKRSLRAHLERFRLTGHDIEIDNPRFIALDIALHIQVAPDYFREQVKEALLDTFSNRVLSNGQLGFFHPDRFTFGQPLFLSQVIAQAMRVVGVRSAVVTRFQRLGAAPQDELNTGQISFDRLEIVRLDNDPSNPGGGTLELVMEGGL